MRLILIPAISLLAACAPENAPPVEEEAITVTYPETRRTDVTDTYFEQTVADPYRWLEDDLSDDTADWVKRQNQVTFSYLEQIPFRARVNEMLADMWNYEKESAPFREGDYLYFYRNDGLQNQDVVYRRDAEGSEEVFLDPNTFSDDGTTSLSLLSFSRDGSLAAYAVSEGGSDWRKVIVINAETGEQLEDPLTDVKFSGISWYKNAGFYYSKYEKPEGSELSEKVDQHLLYYHAVGTSQADDVLVFGGTEAEKHRYVFAEVSEDDRYLFISGAQSTSGNTFYVRDLADPDSLLITVQDEPIADVSALDNEGSTLFLYTNREAPNGRVIKVDASEPTPESWEDVIAETDYVLSPSTGGGYFFARYMIDAITRIYQVDKNGEQVREVVLPGPGTASAPSGKQDETVLYYSFTNYMTPSTIYAFDTEVGESSVYRASAADFNPDDYESHQVFFDSKDGTRVPMIITHKKGIELNGNNPTILYGYGGFDISLTPEFSITNAVWMKLGAFTPCRIFAAVASTAKTGTWPVPKHTSRTCSMTLLRPANT